MIDDVVIVGAGILGSAIARLLAGAGRRVRVLEKSIPGAEASSVAAGILAPLVEHDEGPLRTLGVASRDAYAALADELLDETGIDIGFVRSGVLAIPREGRSPAQLAFGASGESLSGDEARRIEPALAESIHAALWLREEAQVEPPRVLRAFVRSAEARGARFTSGAAVTGLTRVGDRVVGVDTDRGTIPAGQVVLAAGAWTSLVPGLPRVLETAVRPVRGQLVRAELPQPIARHIVFAEHAYIVPRPDGRVICGATMEEAGFAKESTLGAVGALATHATRVMPGLAAARFVEAAVNFRPASVDGLPLIGPSGVPDLWIASGHFRNGILLAPATAQIVASSILGTKPHHDAAPFDPRRLGARS